MRSILLHVVLLAGIAMLLGVIAYATPVKFGDEVPAQVQEMP